MATGRGARGAYGSCRALRQAFNAALQFPDMLGLYCFSAWGRGRAISEALALAPQLFRRLPGSEREQKLRGLLRGLVEAGADMRGSIITDVIKIGSVGLLEELLELMASTPPGMEHHVAACCSALAAAGRLPGLTRDMVALLVRAVTVTAGVSIHHSTFQTAVREAGCSGNSSALAGLLAARPPADCVASALHYAAKTKHGHIVAQLIEAGGEVDKGVQRNALCNAHPQVVRPVVAALQRGGAFDRDAAAHALCAAASRSESYYGDRDAELARVGATVRMLVGEFGADPAARESSCLAAAAAQPEPFNRLAELLFLMGADPNSALVSLCSSVPENGPLEPWQRNRHGHGVKGLLALGAESPEAAARALAAALERGPEALEARLLLGSGAVSAAACRELLLRALGAEQAGAAGGAAAAVGNAQGAAPGAGVQEAAPGAGGGGVEGQPQEQQQQRQRRRWSWMWELALAGALRGGAVAEVERAFEEACREGDVEAVGELASLGVAGPDSCAAAFWLAFDGGHSDCMRRLEALGCVGEGLRAEAQRVMAAREALLRLGAVG